ncbi:MAG: Rrf2 family transcriptional regulator [Betaproteobacteria bacterium]|nr:Rrf2 family transcriptional regulator [Betaproteobacteria bacterium]
MRLNAFTDYSLRVLIYLAIKDDGRATIAEVSRSFGVSEHHLVKVVHFLGKAGFLLNVRGRGGGLRLALPASRINVGEVVRAAEPDPRPAECFDREANTCGIAPVCRLRRVLDDAVKAFHAVLDQYTLEDLVVNRARLASVLMIEPPVTARANRRPAKGLAK